MFLSLEITQSDNTNYHAIDNFKFPDSYQIKLSILILLIMLAFHEQRNF